MCPAKRVNKKLFFVTTTTRNIMFNKHTASGPTLLFISGLPVIKGNIPLLNYGIAKLCYPVLLLTTLLVLFTLTTSISEREQFQTFFKRRCKKNFKLAGFECRAVEIAFETAVWIDDGDDDVLNDKVELKRIWIPLDCALHQKIF